MTAARSVAYGSDKVNDSKLIISYINIHYDPMKQIRIIGGYITFDYKSRFQEMFELSG